MEKKYITYSFSEYPPTEILDTDEYAESIKSLSFQYRTREGDKLIAYIALSKEQMPINIHNINECMTGCRVLGIYVAPKIVNGCKVDDTALRMKLLEESEHYINGWINPDSSDFAFDYYWFYNNDIKKGEIIDEIGHMTTIGDISFKIVKRLHITVK